MIFQYSRKCELNRNDIRQLCTDRFIGAEYM